MEKTLTAGCYVAEHKGALRTGLQKAQRTATGKAVSAGGARWRLSCAAEAQGEDGERLRFTATVECGTAREVAVGLLWEDAEWSEDNYVLIPGAVYAGNRFTSQRYDYPPPCVGLKPGEDRRDLQIIDLPRLRKEPGPSRLDQLSIDAATPAIGVYFPRRRKALLILTPQQTSLGPFNLEVEESADRRHARILVGTPGMRHGKYYSIRYREPGGLVEDSPDRAADLGEGETVAFTVRAHWFDCASVQGLFDRLFELRDACFDDPPLRKEIPYSAAWDIIEAKQNRENWREAWSLYQTSLLGRREPPVAALLFQTGWCGGMINTLPLLQDGGERSVRRALKSLAFYFTGIAPSGFFFPYFDGTAWTCDPGHKDPEQVRPTTLTRRIGDALYFLLRQCMLLRERGMEQAIVPQWEAALRRNAEAILALWERYGDLGQYVNVYTGELEVAGTTSGALVPAALLLAADYFAEPAYAAAAAEIAESYRVNDLADGLTTGGPGDAMQAADSESVFALLESFILLYERTAEPHWLQAARDAAAQGASWAMSYDYQFPEGSALAQISAQSRGAFLANTQNKTAVPGICTLSGQGLLRLYRKTNDARYLELLRQTCHTIAQYMGRKDKRIPCAFSGGNPHDHQPEGWICERVNITQWGEPIGELFAYSTWCEVALMLVCTEIPGVYADLDSDLVVDFDHVHAAWADDANGQRVLRIENPTTFPARVRLLIEGRQQRQYALAVNASASWPVVKVPAGGTVDYHPATESGAPVADLVYSG